MERVILHSDINSCFVSVELLTRPELRGQPVAVAGSVEERHGIVLAKSEEAKKSGVKTGMVLWQAKRLCPELVVLKPHYDRYLEISRLAQGLYSDFTDRQEPFGLDESWLDITGCYAHKDGYLAAEEIRRRMKKELGLTVSVGVSWNKPFAKLGSDYRKPDAVTVLNKGNFREIVWPLPVSELLFVGPATTRTLRLLGITTIGELANAPADTLLRRLGKNGLTLHRYANGMDDAPVRRLDQPPPVKSLSNSITPPRDLLNDEDVRMYLLRLTEEVAGRLRKEGFTAALADVTVRYADTLGFQSHQAPLPRPTDITRELFETAWELFSHLRCWPRALRGIGFRVSKLHHRSEPEQLDLFTDHRRREALRRLDTAVDDIRRRYGTDAIRYLGSDPVGPGFTSFGRH